MFSKTTIVLIAAQIFLSSAFHDLPIETKSARADENYRLPEGVIEVEHYQIQLSLGNDIFETNKFQGTTIISFRILKETNQIYLHSNKIDFVSIGLVNQDDSTPIDFEETSDNVTDFLILTTTTPLPIGSYQLKFEYSALLRTDQMYGFYKSSYTTEDGIVRNLATTQFQPTHARKVFPCFDEPSFKAEFLISILHPKEYVAVGNAASRIEQSGDQTLTTFATTPKMPTYLIAFVVSDFLCNESVEKIDSYIPHFVCSRPEAEKTQKLALEMGPKLTWAMENFTGIDYSASKLSKIHQFAIPDFAAGAMENWGLITYRETALLWDELESSNRYKQRVMTVIAHELGHFWFGDLVTTHWWSDTFLNEGFATYFEYHATQMIDPTLELNKQFVIEQLQPVLVSDASPASAPLSSEVSSPAEVSGRFSSISYNKGGSIFRMVEHFLGLENFKNGLFDYLSSNQFGNTKPEDLWVKLQPVPNNLPVDLVEIMKNWVYKSGYPILTVTASGLDITVTQKRFLSSGQPNSDDLWYIPLAFSRSNDINKFADTSSKIWFPPQDSLEIKNFLQNESDWVIFNNQQIGYYRVDYDEKLWTKIKTALNKPGFDGIHEVNRAQILDDVFNFARYGYKHFSEVLQLYTFLEHDSSYYSWYSAINAFSTMVARTTDKLLTESLSAYILRISDVVYNTVPFNLAKDNDQIYTHKRVLIIQWLCKLGLKNCVDNAVAAFKDYKSSLIKPDKNLRTAIYCNGLRYSTDIANDWEFLWQEYGKAKIATEQITILSTLGCATDEETLKKYLSKSIDATSGIRAQDALSVFSSVYSSNPIGVDVAFDFLAENFETISNYYGAMNSLSSLFSGLANRFTRKDQTDKLENLISSGKLGEAQNVANASLQLALNNLQWTAQFERELQEHFELPIGSGSSIYGPNVFTVLIIFALFYKLVNY